MRLILCFLLFLHSLHGGQLEVVTRARSAILMNGESGVVLYEKHAHIPAYPASTTKIATALYVLDNQIDLNQKAVVTRESLKERPVEKRDQCPPYWLDNDGSMMGLKLGEILSVDILLHGLMMVSGNDAANVLAESIGGSVPQFMDLLNEYLQGIGCKNTQFRNPHGLTHPEHWSTAYDLALMTCKGLKLPKFRQIVSTLTYQKPETNKQRSSEIHLVNPLMKPGGRHYYPQAIGVKTGYTQAAQYNLVAAAEHEGRTLIAVLLGCEHKDDRFEDAKKLFEAAFSEHKTSRRLLGPENIFTKEIEGARAPLKGAVSKPVIITFFPAEEPECKAALHWHPVPLPIRKGQKVGEAHILDQKGLLLQKGDLLATEEVQGTLFSSLRRAVSRLFFEQ